MGTDVFVYGTLLFPEITERLGIVSCDANGNPSKELRREKTVLLGYERFTVRYRDIGNFPAIIRSPDAVNGEVLLDVSEESMTVIDQFEGIEEGYYIRDTVRVRLDSQGGELVKVETYVCGDLLRAKLDGPWDPIHFREHDLDWYMKNVMSRS